MLGEKDLSILGRLKDKMNNTSFKEFKLYIMEKLDYVKDRIGPVKNSLLGYNKQATLGEGKLK